MPGEVVILPERRGNLSVYPFPSLKEIGVDAFFTDRNGGVSSGPYASLNLGLHVNDDAEHVITNRGLVAQAAGVDSLHIVNQVHGNQVVDLEVSPTADAGDVITTTQEQIAIAVLVADCVPLVLADEQRIAVVHAGWRGLDARVISEALKSFDNPSRVVVGIGPRISAEAYQVDQELAGKFSDFPQAILADLPGHARLDLAGIAHAQLIQSGVHERNVITSTQVTDGGEFFFSDRAIRPCGRFALVAKRES
jgi:polyphenol oxidase